VLNEGVALPFFDQRDPGGEDKKSGLDKVLVAATKSVLKPDSRERDSGELYSMGPQLLLDKSTLQSLSYEETWCAYRHYWLVFAPILFIEVLGDLKKIAADPERSKRLVTQVAAKIQPVDSCFTAHCKTVLTANLFGNDTNTDGRPIKLGGTPIKDSRGRSALFFEEEPEQKALGRWRTGEFSEAEHLLSERWRQSTRRIDLDSWTRSKRNLPKVRTISELHNRALDICNSPKYQFENLQFLIYESGIPEEHAKQIYELWLSKDMPLLKNFAPYAHYCLSVYTAFYLGLANRLIGTRSTNRVDLEYVLYLPFCKVFCSNDNFHKQFVPLFLDETQDFVDGSIFKADIKRINDDWQSLSENDRDKIRKETGHYPPDWQDSITNQLWKKHMSPRSEYTPIESTPEREKEVIEHMKPFIDAIDKLKKDQS
jgi:hypothetical protein